MSDTPTSESGRCPAGHPVAATANFCPTCGTVLPSPTATLRLEAPPTVDIVPPPPPPPPPARPAQQGPAPPPASHRSRFLIQAVILVLVLAGAGAAIGLLTGGPKHTIGASPSRSSSATTGPTTTVTTAPAGGAVATTPAPGAGRATVSALAADLRQAVAVRPSVLEAIEGVQSCQMNPTAASQTLQAAINTRHTILHSLPGLALDGVPNGSSLVGSLTHALTVSVQADADYQAWLGDVNGAGQCLGNPSEDANYQHGQAESQAANAAKAAFVGLWDAIAPTYHLPTYTATQI